MPVLSKNVGEKFIAAYSHKSTIYPFSVIAYPYQGSPYQGAGTNPCWYWARAGYTLLLVHHITHKTSYPRVFGENSRRHRENMQIPTICYHVQ